jgi:hypothetical protein
MIDQDWTAEDAPAKGKAGLDLRFSLVTRLVLAFVAACLSLLALYPWGNSFLPEANVLPGPLWLFKTQASEDNELSWPIRPLFRLRWTSSSGDGRPRARWSEQSIRWSRI